MHNEQTRGMDLLELLLNQHDPQFLVYLTLNLLLIILILALTRYLSGITSRVNSCDELSKRDNFAFGISLSGSMMAMALVITGAIDNQTAITLPKELLGIILYGLIGLLLIQIGRWIHDKLILAELDKSEEIRQRNVSVALVDAAASISTAIVIRAVLIWVHGFDGFAILAILTGFIVAQALLLLITRVREYLYRRDNQGASLQQALQMHQIALAIRHGGEIISTALVITSASQFIPYRPESPVANFLGWLIFSLFAMILLTFIVEIAKRFVLGGIDRSQEVDRQQNIGVASLEASISIGLALCLVALMV